MNIAVLDMDNLRNPFWSGGQARATKEICRRLARRNRVTVYCSKYPGYEDYDEDGIKFVHIGLGTKSAKFNNAAYLLFLPLTVWRIKADIMLENFTAPIATSFAPLFTKIPVVALPSFFAPEAMAQKYKINFAAATRRGLKFYKYAISLTAEQDRKLKSINPLLISAIIPNGVDSNYFNYPVSEKNYILFMGRIDINHKGLGLLLDAFSIAAPQIEDELVIMGSGSEEQGLRNIVAARGMSGRVKLLGRLDGEEKMERLSGCKFVVCPSRFETQNISSLESMAMGKPVVCFKIPGLEWIPDDLCLKVRPFSAEDYAACIVRMAHDGALRKTLAEKSKKFASGYDWEKSAQKYEEFFEKVLEKAIM